MKKLILFLLSVYILTGTGFAQSSVWKVEANGNTLYLGGTIHILSPEDYPLPPEFDSAFAWSDIVVLEADIKKLEDPAVAQKMMTMAMYQDERTLKSELSDEAYSMLEEECSRINLSLEPMQKFKPSLIMLFYTVTKMQQSGNTSEGVDQHYLSRSLLEGKNLLYLESVDSQLELLFGGEERDESQEVLQFFDDQEKWEKHLAELKDAWLRGKTKIFTNLQKDMRKEYPEVYQEMIVDRNKNWIPKIETYLDNDSIEFILAGALHMHGPDGILELLKMKDCSILQVK